MAVGAGDLVAYAAINVAGDPPGPTSDTTTMGGARDPDYQVIFTDIAANDDIGFKSAEGADTSQLVKVFARNAAGAIVNEEKGLNGTNFVQFTNLGVVQRILSISMNSNATGIVTVSRNNAGSPGTTIFAIPVGKRGCIRLFRDAASEASGTTRYEKIFLQNDHATLSLLNAVVKQSADASGKITTALATSINDTETTSNRKTAPSGGLTFNDDLKNVVGTNLAAGDRQGVWLKLTLSADDAPLDSTYTIQLAGTTV